MNNLGHRRQTRRSTDLCGYLHHRTLSIISPLQGGVQLMVAISPDSSKVSMRSIA